MLQAKDLLHPAWKPLQGLQEEGHANRALPVGNTPFYEKKL